MRCPAVYFYEYDTTISNLNYLLHRMEIFIVNCPILKVEALQEHLQLHDATEMFLNKISYHIIYLMLIFIIVLLILFVIYYIIKKFEFNQFLFKETINEIKFI